MCPYIDKYSTLHLLISVFTYDQLDILQEQRVELGFEPHGRRWKRRLSLSTLEEQRQYRERSEPERLSDVVTDDSQDSSSQIEVEPPREQTSAS